MMIASLNPNVKVKRHTMLKICVLLGLLTMIFSFMAGYSIFYGSVHSYVWYLFYYGKFVFILLFFIFSYSYYTRDKRLKDIRRWMLKLVLIPLLSLFIYSIVLWGMSGVAAPFITRGCSETFFRSFSYFGGIAFAFVFKEKAPKYGLLAAVITYSCSIVLGISRGKVSFFLSMISGGESVNGFSSTPYLELHEIAFVIGFYLVFLLFSDKKIFLSEQKALFIIGLIYFLTAGKRIGFGAIVAAVFVGLLLLKMKNSYKNRMMGVIGVVGIIACLIYVFMSVSNVLTDLMATLGIEMMGRNIIYDYFRQFCEFKLSYLGHGIGFVSRQFDYATVADLRNMISIRALHNDFMKVFIDLGFVGFCFWCCYWLLVIPQQIKKKAGVGTAFVCFLLIIYAFITYTTDNTEGYINFQLHLCMLVSTLCYLAKAGQCTNNFGYKKKPGEIVCRGEES